MNILSIDWDYFFPNTEQFDWSASEARHTRFYLEIAWPLRYHNTAFFGDNKNAMAKDVMWPNKDLLKDFWDNVLCNTDIHKIKNLAVTESHEDLFYVAHSFDQFEMTIWNFDAHHDYGYGETTNIDCGNWANWLQRLMLCGQYNLVYPQWRRDKAENMIDRLSVNSTINVSYKKPLDLRSSMPKFDHVFICRSGAWTPSWADDLWLEFINYWNDLPVWKNNTFKIDYALKKRLFDTDLADAMKASQDKQLAQLAS